MSILCNQKVTFTGLRSHAINVRKEIQAIPQRQPHKFLQMLKETNGKSYQTAKNLIKYI